MKMTRRVHVTYKYPVRDEQTGRVTHTEERQGIAEVTLDIEALFTYYARAACANKSGRAQGPFVKAKAQ